MKENVKTKGHNPWQTCVYVTRKAKLPTLSRKNTHNIQSSSSVTSEKFIHYENVLTSTLSIKKWNEMILDLTKTAIELQPSLSSLRESNIVALPNKSQIYFGYQWKDIS